MARKKERQPSESSVIDDLNDEIADLCDQLEDCYDLNRQLRAEMKGQEAEKVNVHCRCGCFERVAIPRCELCEEPITQGERT